MEENDMRKSAPTLASLETSRSIRRSLMGNEESASRMHAKLSTSPPSAMASERVLNRSKTGIIFEIGSVPMKWYAGFVVLSLVGFVIISIHPVYANWNTLPPKCPFAPSGHSNRGMGSFGQSGEPNLLSGEGKSESELQQSEQGADDEVLEESKCWSRTRHLLYRPEDRHLPPSPALTRALLDYEALHARCTTGKTWGSMADFQPKNGEEDCKYLIYVEGWEGLGNRLLSLVSAFAFSLATDRVLLIESRGHLASLLCEPFNMSSWKLPQEFPYDTISNHATLDNVEKIENEVGLKLNLRHEQSPKDQSFFCPETQVRLEKVRWLAWSSNQYYVTRLFSIPSIWNKLSPVFPDPSHAFSQLIRYLCLPANTIWAKAERTYQAYLASAEKLVGLQVRVPQMPNFSYEVFEKVKTCLLGGGILPNVSQHNSAPWPFAIRGKRSISDRGAGGTSIFVASLQREYYEALREFYMERGTEDGSLVSVHMVACEGAERFTYDQAVKAYIDMWLLSFADTLVTSAWSTFGYVAQGLGGVHPYIMNLRHDASPPFAYSGHSVEPCNHYPFLSACGTITNSTKEHERWVSQHLKRCQDEPEGLQIV